MTPRTVLNAVPSALTVGNAVAGLAAITAAGTARTTERALYVGLLLVVVGVLLDTIDGPLARALRAQSPLGGQLDSLADGVTFGLASAVLVWHGFVAFGHDVLGFALAAWWLAAVLLRLARFNLENDPSVPHLSFTGLSSPAAALLVTASVSFTAGHDASLWLPVVPAVLLPALMISRLRFVDLPKRYLARPRCLVELVPIPVLVPFVGFDGALGLFLAVFVLVSLVPSSRRAGVAETGAAS